MNTEIAIYIIEANVKVINHKTKETISCASDIEMLGVLDDLKKIEELSEKILERLKK